MSMISVKDLRKSYGDVEAVRGISFDVEEGSFFAFLGPNGAGKSTTISILCSLLKQNSGTVIIDGKDVSDIEVKRSIGVVFQDQVLDKQLTVRENVTVKGAMYGLKGAELEEAVTNVLHMVNAEEYQDRPYSMLSGGQRRRVDIARAMVHKPKLLFLDEPSAGLDPQSRMHIWNVIKDLNKTTGITVFLTTHYMEEAVAADDVIIIAKGEIVAHGSPDQLKDRYCVDYINLYPHDIDSVMRL